MENREMFEEINALVGAIAKALELEEGAVVKALEDGAISLDMITDAEGRNCLEARHQGRTALIYQGAIYRPGDRPEAEETPEEDCSGCSCGH